MNRFILSATLMATMALAPTVSKANSFDENTRYSEVVINSRLNDFYANMFHTGFGVFDSKGNKTAEPAGSKMSLDYVPGLVAKAVLEAVDYYKDKGVVDVKPWFYAVQSYAVQNDITANGKAGKSFDDLNAVKIYSLLQDMCQAKTFPDGAVNSNATTLTTCATRFGDALEGIRTADATYSIKSSTSKLAAGGWWHKASYDNQMWCDGQYMGPALLAQIINDYSGYTRIASTGTDWDLITKQIDISWNYLWNPTTKLLYHAFSATPKAYTSMCWASLTCPYDNTACTNTAYWGRADGWYMFALVDVLQQMDKAGIKSDDANYADIRQKLNTLAEGIAARQDAKTGCWYQLLDKDASYSSQGKSNYLESSATAIFTAAYFKAMRLHYLDNDYTEIAKKAYKGMVENFMISDGNGGVHLVNCCRSAGLGGSSNRKGDCNYYLNGPDVSMTTDVTEGKVLGAFIMAATEYERLVIDHETAVRTTLEDMDKAEDCKVYNLLGMQMPSAKKDEIYIQNGRKMISK